MYFFKCPSRARRVSTTRTALVDSSVEQKDGHKYFVCALESLRLICTRDLCQKAQLYVTMYYPLLGLVCEGHVPTRYNAYLVCFQESACASRHSFHDIEIDLWHQSPIVEDAHHGC